MIGATPPTTTTKTTILYLYFFFFLHQAVASPPGGSVIDGSGSTTTIPTILLTIVIVVTSTALIITVPPLIAWERKYTTTMNFNLFGGSNGGGGGIIQRTPSSGGGGGNNNGAEEQPMMTSFFPCGDDPRTVHTLGSPDPVNRRSSRHRSGGGGCGDKVVPASALLRAADEAVEAVAAEDGGTTATIESRTETCCNSNSEDVMKPPKTIYLIRHAESDENRRLASLGRSLQKITKLTWPTREDLAASVELLDIKAQLDSNVSDVGRRQIDDMAAKLRFANFLQTRNVEVVAHSPLKRARETCEGLLECVAPTVLQPKLMERESPCVDVRGSGRRSRPNSPPGTTGTTTTTSAGVNLCGNDDDVIGGSGGTNTEECPAAESRATSPLPENPYSERMTRPQEEREGTVEVSSSTESSSTTASTTPVSSSHHHLNPNNNDGDNHLGRDDPYYIPGKKHPSVKRVIELTSLVERTPLEWMNQSAFAHRILEFESWLEQQSESIIAIVGHSQYFKTMLGLPYKFRNCDVWELTYTPHGGFATVEEEMREEEELIRHSSSSQSLEGPGQYEMTTTSPQQSLDEDDGAGAGAAKVDDEQYLRRGWSGLKLLYRCDEELFPSAHAKQAR